MLQELPFGGQFAGSSRPNRPMKKLSLGLLVLALFVLHQDVWLWDASTPCLLGFLPPGLVYHAVHTIASAGLLWLLVKTAWPRDLEERGS
jgi:hypothetical protein